MMMTRMAKNSDIGTMVLSHGTMAGFGTMVLSPGEVSPKRRGKPLQAILAVAGQRVG